MAQTLVKNERIVGFLSALTAEVDDLPQLEKDWVNLDNEQRTLVALDWDHLIGDYLAELRETYHRDEMTEEEATIYRRLMAQITECLPIFVRLGLRRPMVLSDRRRSAARISV